MSDPFAAAFTRVPIPEPGPDFERRVIAHAVVRDTRRLRRVRQLLRVYWMSAIAIAAAAVASTEFSALVAVTGAATLAGISAGAVLAAGGIRHMKRVLRTTVG